ncbi:tetratricopeptide repeat protein [Streptomyces hyaluromycini]|uniref:Tetratricopeptide repeat protein n=1 Tax=Streptomyces hyaluromycini TaxID=1377993 RepID=A0ABV1WSJ7_9ACTN
MLDQALVALASASGAAVASAAGTDAWQVLRRRVAGIFGRGDGVDEQDLLERLDSSVVELERAGPEEREQARARLVAAWRTRFHDLLEHVADEDRAELVRHLDELVRQGRQLSGGASAGAGGLAVEGTVDIRADRGSAAAGVMGDVTIGDPERARLRTQPAATGVIPAVPHPTGLSINAHHHSVAAHNINRFDYYAAPPAPISWPHAIGVVPRQAECFQHRDAVEALERTAADGDTAVLCQVLSGTGGVGKTQLAAHYARRSWRDGAVDLLAWITASSRESIVSSYSRLGADVAAADSSDPDQAASRFLTWAETTDRRWLMVLDDLTDPADLRGLWPPANPHGQVLITTRRRDAALRGRSRVRIDVGLFTPDEAASYLSAQLAASGRSDDPDQIAGLAADLGHLPLALAQAAAYLVDLGMNCVTYRTRLADRARHLADLVPDDSGLPDDHRAALQATWSLSVEHADRLRPSGLARPMLHLAGMLDANGIPVIVLTSPPALAYLSDHRSVGTGGQSGSASAEDAAAALRCLDRLSLADHTTDSPRQRVRVHGLIQRTTREALPSSAQDALVVTCADALTAVWSTAEGDPALAQSLRANAEVLISRAGTALWKTGCHPVLLRTGESLGATGLAGAARAYFQDLYNAACRHLGHDHADALTVRHHLIAWQAATGDLISAKAGFADLLTDRVRVLGPDHPDTLATRGDEAALQGRAGDPSGAGEASRRVWEDSTRILGPEHSQTLTARLNVAHWTGEAGNPTEAVTVCEQLLADTLRFLGPDHPKTRAVRLHLAVWRGEAGDPLGAASDFEQLLADQLRLQGADHPQTLSTRHDLARWRGKAGNPGTAVSDFEQLLTDQLRVLGPDHPDTLTTRHDLASWRGESGDAHSAVRELADVLVDRLRVLGSDHPDTLTTRANLAYWRGKSGDAAGAVVATSELLADRLRILGPDHLDTLTTRHNLAQWRAETGDTAGAVVAESELLADRLRVLGPEHPHTFSARHHLAQWTGRAGDPAGATAALAQLLADQLRVLGPQHPATWATEDSLAFWRAAAERRDLR